MKKANKILKRKKVTTPGTDKMAAARTARASGIKGSKKGKKIKDVGLPDFKQLKDRHLKYKDEVQVKLLTQSKLVGYFKALGLRSSKADILAATSEELYRLLFKACLRTVRNNRKTVRAFDIL